MSVTSSFPLRAEDTHEGYPYKIKTLWLYSANSMA